MKRMGEESRLRLIHSLKLLSASFDTGEQQSYAGIIISKYKDLCEPTSIMECHKGFERYLNSLCESRE